MLIDRWAVCEGAHPATSSLLLRFSLAKVVTVHNAMNERTWRAVLEWEQLHRAACPPGATLTRFTGRPTDLSPKARLRMLLGSAAPFDRHDWYVDRCGREVRYVIDFYSEDSGPAAAPSVGAGAGRAVEGPGGSAEQAGRFVVDARPALDSPDALLVSVAAAAGLGGFLGCFSSLSGWKNCASPPSLPYGLGSFLPFFPYSSACRTTSRWPFTARPLTTDYLAQSPGKGVAQVDAPLRRDLNHDQTVT